MTLRKPHDVAYFAAVMYNPLKITKPGDIISRLWGEPVLCSEEFGFTHTDFYTPEMGAGLRKYFTAFEGEHDPGLLPDYKLKALEAENSLAENGKRTINIDPGYLAVEKIVVASTKNFTHRIYIGRGIYGDLQLMRRKGLYVQMPWTYADYIRPETLDFFSRLYALLHGEENL